MKHQLSIKNHIFDYEIYILYIYFPICSVVSYIYMCVCVCVCACVCIFMCNKHITYPLCMYVWKQLFCWNKDTVFIVVVIIIHWLYWIFSFLFPISFRISFDYSKNREKMVSKCKVINNNEKVMVRSWRMARKLERWRRPTVVTS